MGQACINAVTVIRTEMRNVYSNGRRPHRDLDPQGLSVDATKLFRLAELLSQSSEGFTHKAFTECVESCIEVHRKRSPPEVRSKTNRSPLGEKRQAQGTPVRLRVNAIAPQQGPAPIAKAHQLNAAKLAQPAVETVAVGQRAATTDLKWDPAEFSVARFIREYVRNQRESEELQHRRGSQFTRPSQLEAKLESYGRPRTPVLRRCSEHASAPSGDLLRATALSVLTKPVFERTAQDVRAVYKVMRGLPAFGHFSNFILGQICNVLRLHIYEPERVVFGQGEQGTAWYIILKGSVSVQVSPTGKPEDSVVVARLQAGEGFGDLALVEDKPRAATILTTELCELVYVEKADYDRIIKFIHEREIQERCLFLRAVPIFQDWAQASLRAVAQVINWRTYTAGATILAQGDHVQELFIVKTGQCAVIKTFNQEVREAGTVRSRRRHVQLGMLGTFACFGAEAVIDSAASPTARYTIRAWSEGPVECAVMTAFDAKSKLRGTNLMLPFTEYNDETALSGLLQYQLEERKYARLRDTVIRGLLKEWSGDPNASVQSPTVVRGTKHPVDVVTLNRVKLETSGYT